MVEKNARKEQFKRYRIVFEGRFCTIEHKSKKHPDRIERKKQTAVAIRNYDI